MPGLLIFNNGNHTKIYIHMYEEIRSSSPRTYLWIAVSWAFADSV